MKNQQKKSFAFKVAEMGLTDAKWRSGKQDASAVCNDLKHRGCGGCTLVDVGWGLEPMTTPGLGGDGPVFC